jgi:hypothetical protein
MTNRLEHESLHKQKLFCLYKSCDQVALSKRHILASRCLWLLLGVIYEVKI